MIELLEFESKLDACAKKATPAIRPVIDAPIPPKRHTGNDAEVAEHCLKSLRSSRADDYQPWLETGMAVHSAGCDLSVWDEWSRQSPKYQAGVCAEKWATFMNDGNGLTVASLICWAKEDDPCFELPKKSPIAGSSKNEAADEWELPALWDNLICLYFHL